MELNKKGNITIIVLVVLSILLAASIGYIVYDKAIKNDTPQQETEIKDDKKDDAKDNTKNDTKEDKQDETKEEQAKITFKGDLIDMVQYTDDEVYYINKDGELLYGVKKGDKYEYTKVNISEKVNQINYERSCGGDFRVFALDEKGNLYISKSNYSGTDNKTKTQFIKVETNTVIVGLSSIDNVTASCKQNYVKFTDKNNKEYYGKGSCSNDGSVIETFTLSDSSNYSSCMPK